MPITGKFVADFSSFNQAVQEAEVELRSFETNSNKVATSLARMTDQFSGRRVIQDATLMAEAVERIGGVTKLTETELARLGTTAQEAIDKMKALGMEVPPEILKIADAARQASTAVASIGSGASAGGGAGETVKIANLIKEMGEAGVKTGNTFGTLATKLGAVDGILGALGVHIGPEIKAMGELGSLAGSTGSALGVLGPAAAVAGTAIGAWKLGRMVAEATGADTAIANLTARVSGFGDVAAQTAAAKMDVLERATNIAKREITDYGEAVRIATDHEKDLAEQAKKSMEAQAKFMEELNRKAKEQFDSRLQADNAAFQKREAAALAEREAAQKADEDLTLRLTGLDKYYKAVDDMLGLQRNGIEVSRMSLEQTQALNAEVAMAITVAQQWGVSDTARVQALQALNQATAAHMAVLQAEKEAMAASIAEANALTAAYLKAEQAAIGFNQQGAFNRSAAASGMTPQQIAGFERGLVATGQSKADEKRQADYQKVLDDLNAPLTPEVYAPTSTGPSTVVNQTFNVNGTGSDVARVASREFTRTLSVGTPIAVTQNTRK